jgi:hypothetical protein
MKITTDQVKITVRAEKEIESVEHVGKDCAPGFVEAVRAIQRKSRTYGWCTIVVTAKLRKGPKDVEGVAYLGACSYASRQDFINNSGYYPQMVEDAITDLQREYNAHCRRLAEDLTSLADGEDDDLGQLLTEAASVLELTTNMVA